jgi:hypothetical protein
MNRPVFFLAVLVASALASTAAAPQDQANFARTPKVGDKATYAFSHAIPGFKVTLTADISVAVSKIVSNVGPVLSFHMANMRSAVPAGTTDSTKIADDESIQLAAQNLPKGYVAKLGSSGFGFMLYTWVSSTMDKPVKAGDEAPWKTSVDMGGQGIMSLDGTMKIVEVSTANKRLKAQITAKITGNGQNYGTFTNLSTFSLPDCTLVESVGDFHVGTVQEVKFTRKG